MFSCELPPTILIFPFLELEVFYYRPKTHQRNGQVEKSRRNGRDRPTDEGRTSRASASGGQKMLNNVKALKERERERELLGI